MNSLLEMSNEQLNKGLACQTGGDWRRARLHFLQAANHLTLAAEQSEGEIRAKRLQVAQQLLAWATALTQKPERVGAAGRSAQPLTEADDRSANWLVADRPNVTFDDVAGLEDVKDQIRLRLIYPYTHPELAEKYGVTKGGGILLYGPPGTGKTLIARAIAGEIDAAFFTVKSSEVMSKWVGEAEQNVNALFKAASRYERAVIFIDEVDALLPKRSGSNSSVMPRVVSQFLNELQGFREQQGGLLFIGATNEPWALDPAALRPGRFDDKIYVPLPDQLARARILALSLRDRPLADEVVLELLATDLAGYSGADVNEICLKACARPFKEAILTGVERLVLLSDFEAVMQQVKPSVSPKNIERFEHFRDG